MRSCGGGPVGGAASKRCSAGAGLWSSDGCGLACLTLSGNAPHITAGSKSGNSSVVGINGEFPSSMSLSDLLLNASNDSSVKREDCSQDDSVSCGKIVLV